VVRADVQQPGGEGARGDFGTPTDWKDPFIDDLLAKPGNWAFITLNPHSATSTDYFDKALPRRRRARATGSAPTASPRHGGAAAVRFRVSIWFALRSPSPAR